MSMTVNEIYHKGVGLLRDNYIEAPVLNAEEILKKVFNINRQGLILSPNITAENGKTKQFFSLIQKRISGYPLQYIVGEWDFMGNSYKIGEGVLIPREDTGAVVELSYELLSGVHSPHIIDLCSGSGIIAITLAKRIKNSNIIALEKSDKAYNFLCENISLHNTKNITPLLADLYTEYKNFDASTFDLIVSNPPYIRDDEMSELQPEVENEPDMALCGGKDGLDFYFAIAKLWKSKLKCGAHCAVEIGFNQEDDVITIFKKEGFVLKAIKQDINGINRALAFEYK